MKEVVITATPEPKEQKLEIFHWWTGPGEREAADAMFFIVSKAPAAWLFQAFIVVPNVWKALPAVCSASSNR